MHPQSPHLEATKKPGIFSADVGWYTVSGLQYDLNGNIELVTRNTEQNSSAAVLDNLDYDYEGNQLTKVTDTAMPRQLT